MDESERRLIVAVVVLVTLAFAGLLFWLARRAASKQATVKLLPGERYVAFIFVETKQISWGGVTVFGSPYEGKLILTTERLIYANPNETKNAFALSRGEIVDMRKGNQGARMTLELDYVPPKAKKAKHARFMQIGGIGGMLQYVDGSKQMPIGMFIDKLLAWKQAA